MKRLAISLAVATIVAAPAPGRAVVPDPTGGLDHLVCYKARDPLANEAKFDLLARLQPEFSRRGCTLVLDDETGRVKSEFCVPASKVNVEALQHDPSVSGAGLVDDYVCYRVECPPELWPSDKVVTDQFGRRPMKIRQPVRVCVPARKEPLPCGPTGESGAQCGGECPNPGDRCRRDRSSGLCQCLPSECRGRADSAGVCGGTCPNPGEACGRTIDNKCLCAPRPCGIDPTTNACGGECPPETTCGVDAAGECGCLPPPACGPDPATGQCGGPCTAADEVCGPDPNGGCACAPPPPPVCGPDPATGQCGGPCPSAGDACGPGSNGGCECAPPPPPACGPDPATGQCGGSCPTAGDVCGPGPNGGCACLPLLPQPRPCGPDPLSGQCGGDCPRGTVCASVPGTTACECRFQFR